LLDDTATTPIKIEGDVQYGKSKENYFRTHSGDLPGPMEWVYSGDAELTNKFGNLELDISNQDDGNRTRRPDVGPIVETLLPKFKNLLARRACTW